MLRINVGCGQTPTPGWKNYDNSVSVRLAQVPALHSILLSLKLLNKSQKEFISFAQKADVRYANVTKHIPESQHSVDVLYTSHMLEHLDRNEANSFLKEARRVLTHGGIIRVAVPNIRFHIDNYLKSGDADSFIESTHLTRRKPNGLLNKARYLMIGDRNHQWMYDGKSLCLLLASAGFVNPRVMEAGSTSIINPGDLNLSERSPESVFVEAINP